MSRAADALTPAWTPSGKQAKDSAEYKDEECGQREIRVQRAINVPGQDEPVIVTQVISVPHLPYVNMLDPSGNVCAVVVSNNRVAQQMSISYRTSLLTYLRSRKWVRWDFLAQGGAEFEPEQYGLTPEQWHVKREQLRAERLAVAKVASAAFEVRPSADNKDLLEAIKGNQEAITKLLNQADRAQAQGKRGKGADAGAD